MENEKMNNTEVEVETNTNEEVTEETPSNEIKSGHMSLSTIGVWGFYGAALGVRRSFRSTEKCDSKIGVKSCVPKEGTATFYTEERLGENDLKLMKKLVLRGTDEAKFARAIHVQVNIKAPLSWWKQFDTYKVGTVRLSDSTMHNILKDQITTESFAASSIIDHPMKLSLAGAATSRTIFMFTIQTLEMLRINWWRIKNTIIDKEYLDTYGQEAFDEAVKKRKEGMDTCWRQIIDMLPDSYLMESTIDLNYQVLRNICSARDGHKLGKDGWDEFIEWAKTLPYAEDLIFNGYKYLVESSDPIKIQDPEYISSVIKPLNIDDEGESEETTDKEVCKNCTFAEPLEETLDKVLYFCSFRGCASTPDATCHGFKNAAKTFETYNSEELGAAEAEKVVEEAIIYADNEVYLKENVPEETESDGKNEDFHAVEVENGPIFTEADADIRENS